ncbi:hypothetical protein TNCV_3221241 [Trichonephila clavipes]|nr:hypothetical protein TNCV_3221241 [Trichonephila clavipes]
MVKTAFSDNSQSFGTFGEFLRGAFREKMDTHRYICLPAKFNSADSTEDGTETYIKIKRSATTESTTSSEYICQLADSCSVVPARNSSQSSRYCWRSPLPHASALIQRELGCVLGVQQTKQLPHVAKVDLVWQLGGVIWVSRLATMDHMFSISQRSGERANQESNSIW